MKIISLSSFRQRVEEKEAAKRAAYENASPPLGGRPSQGPQEEPTGTASDEPVAVYRYQGQLSIHDIAPPVADRPATFAIPRPTMDADRLSERWLPPGVTVNVRGAIIEGGMLYVGERVRNAEIRDPSAIVPSLNVEPGGDVRNGLPDWWPSYSNITEAQRGAYLRWLAGGRCDPAAGIGYVFLYYYALERRVIADGTADVAARADFPAIEAELHRLLALYGNKNKSFKGYATGLLHAMEVIAPRERLYKTEAVPKRLAHDQYSYMQWALAHCAADDVPLPGRLALQYFSQRRPPKTLLRHRSAFSKLFLRAYEEAFGEGLPLTQSKRHIELSYKAASSGLQRPLHAGWPIADLPQCGNEEDMFEWLQDVGKTATTQIASYSKALGPWDDQRPPSSDSLHALLLLPLHAWPASAARRIESLAHDLAPSFPVMDLAELRRNLRIDGEMNRSQVNALVDALAVHGVGMEPDIAARTKAPQDDNLFALFPLAGGERVGTPSPEYAEARLTMQLAFEVARVDAGADDAAERMDAHAIEWPNLADPLKGRLRAYLRLAPSEPKSTVKSMTRLVGNFSEATRLTIAARVVSLAVGSRSPSAGQVGLLRQIYRALGASPDQAILDIHRLGTGQAPVPSMDPAETRAAASAPAFRLDAARVADLQRDTAHTTALLAGIFVDEREPSHAEVPARPDLNDGPTEAFTSPDEHAGGEPGPLPGLDAVHAEFARFLLTQDEWTRDSLLAAAAARGLMLDGALEVINDAAFDHLDIPFSEGEDPVQINPELSERLAQ